MSRGSSKLVCSALNRMLLACRTEEAALDRAADALQGERKHGLEQQAARRRMFRKDVSAAIRALGGAPAQGDAAGAWSRLWDGLRNRWPSAGAQNVYAACVRASERTAFAYTRALSLELPAELRSGIERQFSGIELDRRELRWLRWGGSVSRAGSSARDPAPPFVALSARRADFGFAASVVVR